MEDQNRLQEVMEWLTGLPPDFAFLLALPFVVAAAALLQLALRASRRRKQQPAETAERRRDTRHRGAQPHHRWQRTH